MYNFNSARLFDASLSLALYCSLCFLTLALLSAHTFQCIECATFSTSSFSTRSQIVMPLFFFIAIKCIHQHRLYVNDSISFICIKLNFTREKSGE